LTPDGTYLLATDESAHELVVYRRRDHQLEAPLRTRVSPFPVSVRVSADGSRCSVASLWPRTVTIIALPRSADGRGAPAREARMLKMVALSSAPRLQLMLRDPPRLVIADAFGGRLAVIDPARGTVESDRTLPAHNIRGLALSADGTRLLVSHQVLSGQA